MNFEDKIKIQYKIYNGGYIQIGTRFFEMNDDGSPDFEVQVDNAGSGYDDNGNPLNVTAIRFVEFGKCVIIPNTSARTVALVDGQTYHYSYEIVAPLSKQKYNMLPNEGDKVWITKKDGTIDTQMEVKGFVTLKKRYLKLWL